MAIKKVIEKKTGEKYASKAAMMKHEKKEGKAEQMKEYGKVKRTPAKTKK
jgi:N-acyl-D-aspartate/D-glutamate deacylase|tara:strand:+ start:1219 stop:1368 length:150 start_codon:yes stop_codon:yes gene_type:complete